jgi:hypothetical protein
MRLLFSVREVRSDRDGLHLGALLCKFDFRWALTELLANFTTCHPGLPAIDQRPQDKGPSRSLAIKYGRGWPANPLQRNRSASF